MESDRSAAVTDAWDRGTAAVQRGEVPVALRHYEYAQRLAPSDAESNVAIAGPELSRHDPSAQHE